MIGARPLHRNVSTQMGRDKARVERDFIEYYTVGHYPRVRESH